MTTEVSKLPNHPVWVFSAVSANLPLNAFLALGIRDYNPSHSMRTVRLNSNYVGKLRQSLLSWYDGNRRDLPWRKTRDPYRIWVSEIMLQQTRVGAVLPKYERFLRRFASVQQLAAARESTVLTEWSGLGYYRRARNLHAAAKLVSRAGKFPQSSEAWRTLPGIGRYTAAAIASIGFNEAVAVLDGNVERVLRRLFNRTCSGEPAWKAAAALLDPLRPGDFNQAMMELGATVCLPGEPNCAGCPISIFCRTRGPGRAVRSKPRQQKRELTYMLIQHNDSVLLVKRPPGASLMPGMWELPSLTKSRKSDEPKFSLRHSITVTDFEVHVVRRRATASSPGPWIKVSRLNSIPLTGLARKILRKARIIL